MASANRKAFKVTKNVTLPILSLKPPADVLVKLMGLMFTGKETTAKVGGKPMEAPQMIDAVDMDTGEECRLIAPTVLQGILREEYEEKSLSYVGKCFHIRVTRDLEKKYNHVQVAEVEIEDEPATTDTGSEQPAAAPKKKK